MPNRSDRRPSMTPPHAKPNMVSVNGSAASARATPNSACTAGSTTGTDHMPTLPMVPSTTATPSRHQAKEDSTPAWSVPDLSMSSVRAAPQDASSSFRFGYWSGGPSLPTGRTARNSNPPGRRMPAWLLRIVTWPRRDLSRRRPGVVRFPATPHGHRTASNRTQRRITSTALGGRTHDRDDDRRSRVSTFVVRPTRSGRLRARASLFQHDRREGRNGGDARRRENRGRHLSPGYGRQAPCTAGPVDSQQGPAGSRGGGGVTVPSGLVDVVDRPSGSRRYALFRRARLRACDRQSARHRKVGGWRLSRLRQLRSHRMDRGPALVRRQCGHDRHFRLRRGAIHGREAQPAPPQGNLSIRSAPRLPRSWRVARRMSRRSPPSLPLPAAGLCLSASAEGPAQAAAAGAGKALAGGDRQSRLPDVSARLQRARAKGPAFPGLFRHSRRSLRQGGGSREKRGRVFADHGADLYRLGLVRLHIQDPPHRSAELVSQHRSAQETSARGPRPPRPDGPFIP